MEPTTPSTQPTPSASPPTGLATPTRATETTAKIIYVLYLVSLFVGVTALIGVIMAYVYIGDAPEGLKTHYRFQIRTFWIGVLYGIVGTVLLLAFGLGMLVYVFAAVWIIVRCVKGLRYLDRREPYPNVTTWLW
jgi:uncharacterized membrane protein